MSIQNGLGVTGYRRTQSPPVGLEGAPAALDTPLSTPVLVALLAQITTLAIGTFADDTDTFTVGIETPDGEVHSHTVTRASSVPVDAAAAATAMAALINADVDLIGHVEASGSTTNLVLTFLHPNVVYPVTHSESGVTITPTETQAPGASAIPYGRFVAPTGTSQDGAQPIRLLTSSDTEDAAIGVTARPIAQHPNAGSDLASAVDGIPAGKMGDAFYDGLVYLRNNGDTDAAMGGPVHVVLATTGGDEIGEARSDGDGAAHVATATVVADHQNYSGHVGVWIDGRIVDVPWSYNPTDGTTTTDDVVDGLEDAVAASITALVSAGVLPSGALAASAASATATFTITAAAGYRLAYAFFDSFGEDTEAVGGTFAAFTGGPYTIQLPRSRARWAERVAAGQVGPVSLHLI
jgi:hypothetical protein